MKYFLSRAGIYLITFLLAICFFRVNGFFNNKKSEIIKADGLGYYSYLPALFIYGDYSQEFLKSKFPKYYQYNGIPEYMETINNRPVDKYFFGTAVLMYPFFMTAHLLSYYFQQPHDGYSILYQYLIGLSAVFYVFVGLFFCSRLLRIYGATNLQAIFICAILVFATNIYFYAVAEPSMSHVYSFAMISAFLYFSKEIFEFQKSKYIIPALISLGLVALIRPFNIIIILSLPFLAGSFRKLGESFRFIFQHYVLTLLGVLLAFIIVSLQMIIWYKQTGQFIVYSYTYERFYFDKPNFINVLFSYQKGLFIYSPLLFLSLAGLILLFRKNRFSALFFLIFFIVLVYVMSCWHVWYYGASFGFRPMIDYFALFGILLLFSLNLFKHRTLKIIFITLCFCTLILNQVQSYQYRKFILHWNHMSSYKYWRVFLRTDIRWSGYVWDNPEPSDLSGTKLSSISTGFEKQDENWLGNSVINIGDLAHSGNKVTLLDSNNIYSNTVILNDNSRLTKFNKLALIAIGYIHINRNSSADKLNFVVHYQKKDGSIYYYRSRLVDNLFNDSKGWKRFEIGLRIDKPELDSDIVKIYFWNPEKQYFFIDDVSYEFVGLE